jgi:hypothetical protein
MQLRPRHFVLLAIVIGLFVFNIIQYRRRHNAELRSEQPNAVTVAAWSAFDHAAALRDAPDGQFLPAFNALRSATEGDATTPYGDAFAQVRACKTWLLFYRQPQWQANARKHVDDCAANHRDLAK